MSARRSPLASPWRIAEFRRWMDVVVLLAATVTLVALVAQPMFAFRVDFGCRQKSMLDIIKCETNGCRQKSMLDIIKCETKNRFLFAMAMLSGGTIRPFEAVGHFPVLNFAPNATAPAAAVDANASKVILQDLRGGGLTVLKGVCPAAIPMVHVIEGLWVLTVCLTAGAAVTRVMWFFLLTHSSLLGHIAIGATALAAATAACVVVVAAATVGATECDGLGATWISPSAPPLVAGPFVGAVGGLSAALAVAALLVHRAVEPAASQPATGRGGPAAKRPGDAGEYVELNVPSHLPEEAPVLNAGVPAV